MKDKAIIVGVFLLGLLPMSSVFPYMFTADITANIDGEDHSHSFKFNSVEEVLDTFTEEYIDEHFSDQIEKFDSTSDYASGDLTLRGLPVHVEYNTPPPDSSLTVQDDQMYTLDIEIPDAFSEPLEFTAGSLDELDEELKEFFKGEDNTVIKEVFQAMVSSTPYDPLAGNPDSLMANMIDKNYILGDNVIFGGYHSLNLFSLNPNYSSSYDGSHTVKSVTLPLHYSHVFPNNRTTLLVNMPVSRYEYDKSISYDGQVDVALKNKINDYWSMTPSVAVGGEGSQDMGSFSLVYSGFLKNQLAYPYHGWSFGVNNMAGYLQTQDLNFADYQLDYGLKNWAYENGIDMGHAWRKLLVNVGVSHTNLTGSEWYYDHYETVSLSLAKTKTEKGVRYKQLSLNTDYVYTKNYHRASLGLMYQI